MGQSRRISPRYTVADWQALDLSTSDSPDWSRGVDIFLDRLNGRFLEPVTAVRMHENQLVATFSGFTIIAIDCLVIETLIQFYRGEDETSGKHEDAFAEFLNKSQFFSQSFNTKTKAHIFYRHFRCGILHQAQTKKGSLIRFSESTMVSPASPNDINEGLVIDRDRFHDALLNEIKSYANALKAPMSILDMNARQNFKKKMGFITC